MADTSLSKKQQLTQDLAAARQTVELLKSELRNKKIDPEYWMARMEDVGQLLKDVVEERSTTDKQGRFAALYEVSKVLGSSLHVKEVLNQVMDSLIELTGAERGYLMLFDDEGELEVKAARNLDRTSLDKQEFAYSRSVIKVVAETGEQVVTNNASDDPRFAQQESVVVHNMRSIQCVPLHVRGEIIGVIYVDNKVRAGAFEEADLEMLVTFAAQAAIAIENARLFTMTDAALEARVQELSMMQKIDRQLNETLDIGTVMDLTLEWALGNTESDNGAIGIINRDENTVTVVAEAGESPFDLTTLLTNDLPESGDGNLIVPIQREGNNIGVIALSRNDQTPFSDYANDFAHRLADHAAVALQNARLYQEVQQANQAKSEFVSVVTHELRIPMTSIKGYTDMILMSGDVTDQQKSFLDIIRSNVERMSLLVSDLSDISRIESGRMQLDIEDEVDVQKVLGELLPALENEIEKRDHTLKVDFANDIGTVRSDPHRLGQILTNLISNAYKYTPNGGTITVKAERENGFVRCSISDTGVGMTPEEVNKLFTKFWRADDLHVREQTGTGLGLTIAKNLVELQGGEMVVKSEKGVGTTFSFTVPIS